MLKRILCVAIITELILLIGFLPTLFNPNAHIYGGSGGGWDWSPWTFVGPMAGVLFLTGMAMDFAWRNIRNPMYRWIVIAALILAVIALWMMVVHSG